MGAAGRGFSVQHADAAWRRLVLQERSAVVANARPLAGRETQLAAHPVPQPFCRRGDPMKKAADQAMSELVATVQTDLERHISHFNERFYVVEAYGGKCRVCWEEIDPVTRNLVLGHQSFNDFSNRFMHEKVEVGQRTDRNGNPTQNFMTQA